MDTLPLVLLGLRSAFKEDLQCTTAELVYGTTLRLPGEFFDTTSNSILPDQHTYVSHLRNTMQHIQPVPTSHHATCSTQVRIYILVCTFLFVTMPSGNCYSHHMMDHLKSSNEPPSFTPSWLMVISRPFHLIDSCRLTSTTPPSNTYLHLCYRQLHPPLSLCCYHVNSQQDRPDRVAVSIFRNDTSRPPTNSNIYCSLVTHLGGGVLWRIY